MHLDDEDDDLDEDEERDSSDDEAGMEQKGVIDEDNEAAQFEGAAQEGGPNTMFEADGDMGIAEARQAIQE